MTRYNLSEAEYEIMEYIWKENRQVTFAEVMALIQERGHEWKKQTVQTFLTRLIEKGALKADKEGRKKYYYPAMTKEKYVEQWTRNLVDVEFKGSLKGFLAAFTGGEKLNKEETEELKQYLEEE